MEVRSVLSIGLQQTCVIISFQVKPYASISHPKKGEVILHTRILLFYFSDIKWLMVSHY